MELSFGSLEEVSNNKECAVLCCEGVAPAIAGEIIGENDEVVLAIDTERRNTTNHVYVNTLKWVRGL